MSVVLAKVCEMSTTHRIEAWRAAGIVVVPIPDPATLKGSRYRAELTPAERIAGLDALAESLRGAPNIPDSAFDGDTLYQ